MARCPSVCQTPLLYYPPTYFRSFNKHSESFFKRLKRLTNYTKLLHYNLAMSDHRAIITGRQSAVKLYGRRIIRRQLLRPRQLKLSLTTNTTFAQTVVEQFRHDSVSLRNYSVICERPNSSIVPFLKRNSGALAGNMLKTGVQVVDNLMHGKSLKEAVKSGSRNLYKNHCATGKLADWFGKIEMQTSPHRYI